MRGFGKCLPIGMAVELVNAEAGVRLGIFATALLFHDHRRVPVEVCPLESMTMWSEGAKQSHSQIFFGKVHPTIRRKHILNITSTREATAFGIFASQRVFSGPNSMARVVGRLFTSKRSTFFIRNPLVGGGPWRRAPSFETFWVRRCRHRPRVGAGTTEAARGCQPGALFQLVQPGGGELVERADAGGEVALDEVAEVPSHI